MAKKNTRVKSQEKTEVKTTTKDEGTSFKDAVQIGKDTAARNLKTEREANKS